MKFPVPGGAVKAALLTALALAACTATGGAPSIPASASQTARPASSSVPSPEATSAAPTASSSASAESVARYESESMPIALDLGSEWTAGAPQGDGSREIIETWQRFKPTLSTFTIRSTALPAGTTPDADLEELLADRQECATEEVAREDTTLGGQPASIFEYECDGRRFADVATHQDGRRYVLRLGTGDAALARELLDPITASFQFTE